MCLKRCVESGGVVWGGRGDTLFGWGEREEGAEPEAYDTCTDEPQSNGVFEIAFCCFGECLLSIDVGGELVGKRRRWIGAFVFVYKGLAGLTFTR